MNGHRYFILHKPINMVSQFVSSHAVRLLGDLDFIFPAGTHAIGRLDQNSEGLLLLTTNKKVTKLLFQGAVPHKRTYWVQVKNKVEASTIKKLAAGIEISAPNGSIYSTSPCEVTLIADPNLKLDLQYVLHKNVVTSWLSITLTEGKFHQVRKMVAAVHHKCLRLIRASIESIDLEGLDSGAVVEIEEHLFFEKLRLNVTD